MNRILLSLILVLVSEWLEFCVENSVFGAGHPITVPSHESFGKSILIYFQ